MTPPLLAFFGDDFTGSTDVMEALCVNGVKTVLFLEAAEAAAEPLPEDVRAVGVAGLTRSMAPDAMERVLSGAFASLASLGAPLVHYKVCSTFDSSPGVGSIGRAIEVGRACFGPSSVPVCIGAPHLGRYVVFGNLFARVGSEVHRLDRHPTMSRHPVTPMDESDLRRHLSRQTGLSIGSLSLPYLGSGRDLAEAPGAQGRDVVVCDTLSESDLTAMGRLLWEGRTERRFVVGSSGVEWALADCWRRLGLCTPSRTPFSAGPVDHLLVVTGSASPVTDRQIGHAVGLGYEAVRLDLPALLDARRFETECRRLTAAVAQAFGAGRSLVLFSARGPEDVALLETRAYAQRVGIEDLGAAIGSAQGRLLSAIRDAVDLPRVVVAGGDTSGHVTRALGVRTLEFLMPIAPGAPLCLARFRSGGPPLQLLLKGGQNGSVAFFEAVRTGRSEYVPVFPGGGGEKGGSS